MFSMTGYGKSEYSENGLDITVEIKTVNNRNFDFNAKTPRAFICLEDKIRKAVAEKIKRGRIDLFLNYTDHRDKDVALTVDTQKAKAYFGAANEIAKTLNIENDCTVSYLIKCPDVLTDDSVFNAEELTDIVINTVNDACDNLNEMRRIEGEKLISEMLSGVKTIEELTDKIAERAPKVVSDYKEKLKARITEALADVKFDETRLLNEVAFYTDKVNIDEELTRLRSHIAQFREIVKTPNAGKKLDFLMQEFNRETNTICSKSNDITVTGYGLSLKNEIEKVREQVQNIE